MWTMDPGVLSKFSTGEIRIVHRVQASIAFSAGWTSKKARSLLVVACDAILVVLDRQIESSDDLFLAIDVGDFV
jgi:hypothetical protein